VRSLVTDTGWGTEPDEIRTSPWVGNPWWANYFPTTKNPPEAPRYNWRGGVPPPP
jgi:phospholipid/cholesterol/gamma-HCH transport system substrate-binding protein